MITRERVMAAYATVWAKNQSATQITFPAMVYMIAAEFIDIVPTDDVLILIRQHLKDASGGYIYFMQRPDLKVEFSSPTINNHTCPSCKNDRCSKGEKCGGIF